MHEGTVVYACDDRYALPLTVSIRSLQENTPASLPIIVVSDGISISSRNTVLASVPRPGDIEFIDVGPTEFPHFGSGIPAKFSRAVFGRLLVPDRIIGTPRFLYLDSDTVVLSDVTRLLRLPLDGKTIGAVYDSLYTAYVSSTARLGAPGRTERFNSGVLLIDRERWFDLEIGPRALEYSRSHACLDQGGLNAICEREWQRLDQRWNRTTFDVLQQHRRLTAGRVTSDMTTYIRHYTADKPWIRPRLDRAELSHGVFLSYLDRTRWGR
ncbi:glycosyltransferase family 8 protein [Kribbella sp. NPDC051587]|uniref:glycosyltransferase family 8 protein n=1 Tax=Kribbella sp. NPDC051587 TaxID=3364119 RepID=UPI003798F6E0